MQVPTARMILKETICKKTVIILAVKTSNAVMKIAVVKMKKTKKTNMMKAKVTKVSMEKAKVKTTAAKKTMMIAA